MVFVIQLLYIFISLFSFLKPSYGNEVLDRDMVYFSAGEFEMGSPKGTGKKNEYPNHKVYLDAYYLDKFEVTFADFEAYLEAHPNKYPTITGWIGRKTRTDMIKKPVFGLQWKRCRN